MTAAKVVRQLRAVLPADVLLEDPASTGAYAWDAAAWAPAGTAAVVGRPRTAEQVQAVARACLDTRTPVVPLAGCSWRHPPAAGTGPARSTPLGSAHSTTDMSRPPLSATAPPWSTKVRPRRSASSSATGVQVGGGDRPPAAAGGRIRAVTSCASRCPAHVRALPAPAVRVGCRHALKAGGAWGGARRNSYIRPGICWGRARPRAARAPGRPCAVSCGPDPRRPIDPDEAPRSDPKGFVVTQRTEVRDVAGAGFEPATSGL